MTYALACTPSNCWLLCFSNKEGATTTAVSAAEVVGREVVASADAAPAAAAAVTAATPTAAASAAQYFQDTWLPRDLGIDCQVRAIAPETPYMLIDFQGDTQTWTYYTENTAIVRAMNTDLIEHKDVPHSLVKVLLTTSAGGPFVGWMWVPQETKESK